MNAEHIDIVKRLIPVECDITVYAGDTYKVPVNISFDGAPFELPTSQWNAHIREATDRKVFAAFNVDSTDAATGKFILSLTKEQSKDLPSGYWDFELTHPDVGTKTWVYGKLTVIRDVTHV